MALYGDNYIFLHFPKAGGMSISSILRMNGAQEIGKVHSAYPDLYLYEDTEFFRNKFHFVFVRHPIYWYISRWCFRISISGWEMTHEMDYKCASNDFNQFILNIHKEYSAGWFNREVNHYIDNSPRMDFVGRLETMDNDMMSISNRLGLGLSKTVKKINQSLALRPRYTKRNFELVMATNESFINKYYSDFTINEEELIL